MMTRRRLLVAGGAVLATAALTPLADIIKPSYRTITITLSGEEEAMVLRAAASLGMTPEAFVQYALDNMMRRLESEARARSLG